MIPVSVTIVSDRQRRSLGFLDFALSSLRKNSSVEHDVVVVSDDDFGTDLSQWKPRLVRVEGPFVIPGLGSRLYEWLNRGARAAKTDWILTPAGDDSYFFPGWERLLEPITQAVADRTVWSPAIVETGAGSAFRLSHNRPAELQITLTHGPIRESELLKLAAENCPDLGILKERPHERHHSHWAHTVQHQELFWRAGGFIEMPPWPDAHDLHLHDKYTHMGVTKVCVTGARIGNCKVPVELGT
jgi:hypothetical protein